MTNICAAATGEGGPSGSSRWYPSHAHPVHQRHRPRDRKRLEVAGQWALAFSSRRSRRRTCRCRSSTRTTPLMRRMHKPDPKLGPNPSKTSGPLCCTSHRISINGWQALSKTPKRSCSQRPLNFFKMVRCRVRRQRWHEPWPGSCGRLGHCGWPPGHWLRTPPRIHPDLQQLVRQLLRQPYEQAEPSARISGRHRAQQLSCGRAAFAAHLSNSKNSRRLTVNRKRSVRPLPPSVQIAGKISCD